MLYKKRATFYLHEHEITISPFNFQARYINNSMTSLLTHNVPHSTRHSFRPKTNNQPLKKVFESYLQLSKRLKKLDIILENKVV